MTNSSHSDEGGFTLIELTVVMVVVGVLAGIVLMGVGQFRSDASTSRDLANNRQCATAITIYRARHTDTPPTSWAQIAGYLASAPANHCSLP